MLVFGTLVRISVGITRRKRSSKRMSVREAGADAGTKRQFKCDRDEQTPTTQGLPVIDNDTLRAGDACSFAYSKRLHPTFSLPPPPASTVLAQSSHNTDTLDTPSPDGFGALPSPLYTTVAGASFRMNAYTVARLACPATWLATRAPNAVLCRLREGANPTPEKIERQHRDWQTLTICVYEPLLTRTTS